jgi:hypothetical protein
MAEGCEAPNESLNVLNVPDLTHVSDGRDLVSGCFDFVLSDDVSQELALGTLKVHSSGFNLMLNHWRLLKVSSRSKMTLLLF